METPKINVEVVDNNVYVSESTRTPGYTYKRYYPVEY